MKKTLIAVCALVLVITSARDAGATILLQAPASSGLTDYYVGTITPGRPADPLNELADLNYLRTLAMNTPPSSGPYYQTYSRIGSPFSPSQLPEPFATHYWKQDNGNNRQFSVTGFTYLLAKYDSGGGGLLVWKVDGITDTVVIPDKFNNKGLSQVTMFEGAQTGPETVPDAGATVMLLGVALVGLGALRSKFRA